MEHWPAEGLAVIKRLEWDAECTMSIADAMFNGRRPQSKSGGAEKKRTFSLWDWSNEWIVMSQLLLQTQRVTLVHGIKKRYPKQNSRIMMEQYKRNNLTSIITQRQTI